jgi:pimeloyl-ACP methyl ester carboxylesterase
MFPPTMGHEWLARLLQHQSQSQHITVPGVGHLVMAEAPNVVNQAIERMLLTYDRVSN